MPRDDAYLLDILLMARDAREFTKDHTRESFARIGSASMPSSGCSWCDGCRWNPWQ